LCRSFDSCDLPVEFALTCCRQIVSLSFEPLKHIEIAHVQEWESKDAFLEHLKKKGSQCKKMFQFVEVTSSHNLLDLLNTGEHGRPSLLSGG